MLALTFLCCVGWGKCLEFSESGFPQLQRVVSNGSLSLNVMMDTGRMASAQRSFPGREKVRTNFFPFV